MIADLHLHTNESDGTWTPKQLVLQAAKHSLAAIAITDHDTTAGIREASKYAPTTLEIIPGVELSCGGTGFEEVHILGLWIDVNTPSLQEHLAFMRRARLERMDKILLRLQEMGIFLSHADVAKFASKNVLSRSHVASALVERGIVSTKTDAFEKYIGEDGPAYVARSKLNPERAIDLILGAGGVPILAHPGLLKNLNVLPRLTAAGLVGIEVIHPSHSQEKTDFFLEIADKWKLLPSGGSDCHGPGGKDRVFLGDYTIPHSWMKALAETRW